MAKNIQAIRGMRDILPAQTPRWQYLEDCVRHLLGTYGYEEIRLPLVEKTELFKRSIGEVTDIVEKEMYTFEDRNGDSLTLRPEGTASAVRAGIEHGLLHNAQQRLWYMGPMFRHERPQKGRYRQFQQIGVEAFGMQGPDIDAELILMTARLWTLLGLQDVHLEINSLGSREARAAYREKLVSYLEPHKDRLDEDSLHRLHRNPLRILDSKNPAMQDIIERAPKLSEHLDEASQLHFVQLRRYLDAAGVTYTVNPRLVRGLDYYSLTVFEWITQGLGAQGTICAGGRYDGLVEQLGGRASSAAGFAMGLERIITLLEDMDAELPEHRPHAYLVAMGDLAVQRGLILAERLRDELPWLRLRVNGGGGGFKAQFRRADRSGAQLALILGDEECQSNKISIKPLRIDGEQLALDQAALAAELVRRFAA